MLGIFKKIVVFVLLISVSYAASISDEQVKQSAMALEPHFRQAMKKLRVPGAAFVVARKGKIVHTACFGIANENGENVEKDTMFALSSLTKNVTAIIVGALIDEGKLNFDDKVRKYLPNFFIGNEDISSKFTIRDLISHRSGFKHFLADSLWSSGHTKQQMMNSLRYINNVSGFRKKYGYQNIIFGIIEDVLERATGKTYEQLVEEYIVSKLQLQNTSALPLYVSGSWFELFKHSIKRYGFWHTLKNIFSIKRKKITTTHTTFMDKVVPLKQNDYFQRVIATAGVSMSIEDLGVWLKMLLGKGSVDKSLVTTTKTFEELSSNQVKIEDIKDDSLSFPPNRLSDIHYGMGFFNALFSDNGLNAHRIWFHMGGVYGTSTFLAFSLADDISICVMCNFGSVAVTTFPELMTWKFFDICFNFKDVDWAQFEIDHKARSKKEREVIQKTYEENNPGPHAALDQYSGTYTCKIYSDIKVYTKKDCLIIDNGIRKAKIEHVNNNIFKFRCSEMCENYYDTDEYVVFYRGQNGKFDQMYISCFGENQNIFEKKGEK
ncbi:MAG: serine hydrolase [Holosporales bacterium]|jgi:CubicO group peptidase (beta-lactamase class C family)|nr:serine hydrolase [Holosporales bacterium]